MPKCNMDEGAILTIITGIVQKNGCWIEDFDYKNRILDIDGPNNEALVNCAIELEDKLGEYLV